LCATSGISPSFLGLSRSSGQVTHVLLTRSRLGPRASPGSSHHLHVVSTPPAFVLSQDQTLRERYFLTELSCPLIAGYTYVATDMTVNQTTRCAGAPSGSGSNIPRTRMSAGARCSVFKDRCASSAGLAVVHARDG